MGKDFAKTYGRLNPAASVVSSYLLDAVPTAVIAYSSDKLRSAYAGSAAQIRETGDNTNADIGFDGDVFDTAEYNDHVGVNQGFVRTWYDQSGNSRHASQTTNGSQLEILLNQQNSKPALLGASGRDMAISSLALGAVFDVFVVFSRNSTTGDMFVGGGNTGGGGSDMFFLQAGALQHIGSQSVTTGNGQTYANGFHVLHIRKIGPSISWSRDGVLKEYMIGATTSGTFTINTLISELASINTATKTCEQVIYTRGISAAEVQLALNNIGTRYNITVSTPYVTTAYSTLKSTTNGLSVSYRDYGHGHSFKGDIYFSGGWNELTVPVVTNEQYKSTDGGVNWSQLSDAEWSERDGGGYVVLDDGDTMVQFADSSTGLTDVWLSTDGENWTEDCADWGPTLFSFAWTKHDSNNTFLVIGGSTGTFATGAISLNVYSYNRTTKVLDLIGTLPGGGTRHDSMCAVDYNGDIYACGGGDLNYDNNVYNSRILKSTDGGVNWSNIGTLPSNMLSNYPSLRVCNGRVYYGMGSNKIISPSNSNFNTVGLWSTTDFQTWYAEPGYPRTHAAPLIDHNGILIKTTANLDKLVYAITP